MSRFTAGSDAAIRSRYYRAKRRSPEAQAIAEDLERTDPGYSTSALSRWNRGEDPTLDKISEASAMVSPRGFTAAASRRDRASITQAVNDALSAEPTEGLPAAARGAVERRKDRLRKDYESFMGDADEYSGKSRGDYTSALPPAEDKAAQSAVETEQALQRQGLSAEDYWERNPEAKRTARNSKGEEVDVTELSRKYQNDRAQENQREENFQQALANNRAEAFKQRRVNEEESADRYANFITDIDMRERDKSKAAAYLKSFKDQVRASRQIAQAGGPRNNASQFWDDDASLQATSRDLSRMSTEDQLKWASSQVKKDEKARAEQVNTASGSGAVTEDQVADFFNRPFSLTDFVKAFFGGAK